MLKFDPDGNLVWQRTWGGSGFESAEGVAVGADGSIHLAGSTERTFREDSDAFVGQALTRRNHRLAEDLWYAGGRRRLGHRGRP